MPKDAKINEYQEPTRSRVENPACPFNVGFPEFETPNIRKHTYVESLHPTSYKPNLQSHDLSFMPGIKNPEGELISKTRLCPPYS